MSTQTAQQAQYIESCVKGAISEIANLDENKIQIFHTIANQCYADILSEISVMTKLAHFAINNYADINADTLASLVENEKLVFSKNSFSNSNIILTQELIKSFTSSLTDAQNQLMIMYNLEPNSLNIYNDNEIEANINFKQGEQNSPLMFKYYEGKVTLKAATGLIQLYTELKNIFDNNRKSLSILTTNRASDVLVYFSDTIKQLIQSLTNIQFTVDTTNLAYAVFTKFLLSTDKNYNSFLSRNYDTIRNDVIGCYLELYPPTT